MCSATILAYFNSLKSCSSKPMENVLTGCRTFLRHQRDDRLKNQRRRKETRRAELRKSFAVCVDSRKIRVVSSIASSSEIFIFFEKSGCQYRLRFDFAVFPAQPMRRFEFANLFESGLRRGNAQITTNNYQSPRNQLRAKCRDAPEVREIPNRKSNRRSADANKEAVFCRRGRGR